MVGGEWERKVKIDYDVVDDRQVETFCKTKFVENFKEFEENEEKVDFKKKIEMDLNRLFYRYIQDDDDSNTKHHHSKTCKRTIQFV